MGLLMQGEIRRGGDPSSKKRGGHLTGLIILEFPACESRRGGNAAGCSWPIVPPPPEGPNAAAKLGTMHKISSFSRASSALFAQYPNLPTLTTVHFLKRRPASSRCAFLEVSMTNKDLLRILSKPAK